MIDASRILEIAQFGLARAWLYFGVGDDWKIAVQVGTCSGDARATTQMFSDYRHAALTFHPFYDDEAQLWGDVGHEVAHIVLADLEPTRAALEQEGGNEWSAAVRMFKFGIERAVNNLERMWVRDHPWPPPEFRVATDEKV